MKSQSFQILLGKYFDGAWFDIKDGLLSLILRRHVYNMNASKMITAFSQRKVETSSEQEQRIVIPVYDGRDSRVMKMMNLLENLGADLYGAIVHGSIASGEMINYSDFDGLIIIRNDVFKDKSRLASLAQKIHESKRIMFEIDPLQHHGWFVITEADLNNFPIDYLPLEVLAHSKSLLAGADLELNLRPKSKADYFSSVKKICRRIRKTAQPANRPVTLYQLKSLLSEFMMLPTLYIQARDQRGIFKKYSFEAASADFNESTWKIMDEVSEIRANWQSPEILRNTRKLRKIGYIWMKYRKKMGPAIPKALTNKLNDDFYRRMAELANQVEVNLFR
ncbi:MAG: hypothetical protein EYC69_14955 [Bacteroidetes bacterium]|nr:MAG: hypothetical protein EYC69_14955 [Bacteroidota bacterium]